MSSVWLTRIGIVISIFGGFLVMPELIGIERIQRAQDWLIAISAAMRPRLAGARDWAFSDAAAPVTDHYFLPRYAGVIFLLLVIPFSIFMLILNKQGLLNFLGSIPIWLIILVFVFIGPVFVWLVNVRVLFEWEVEGCVPGCIPLVVGLPLSILYLTGIPLWLLLTILPLVASVPFVIISRTLSGRERMKRILVRAGVVMLILGGGLQVVGAK